MSFDKPDIVVVGAGAMGSLFGGLLAEGGLDVTLLDVWPEHVAEIRAKGLKIVGVGGDRFVKVKATSDAREIQSADVVLFQCKSFANEAAANSVKHLFGGHTAAITFQNGLGNEEKLASILGAEAIIGGLTAQGGLVEAPGVVRNFGALPTYIGEMSGGKKSGEISDRTRAIAAAFSAHGLSTIASAEIKREKWKKLLGNVALGAISAVLNLRSFEIMRVPELQRTVFRILDEAALVANAEGIILDVAQAREVLMTLVDTKSGGTGMSKSSMCEDILRRRPTEIDTIHGAVAARARKHGINTPTLDSLIALVKGAESLYLNKE